MTTETAPETKAVEFNRDDRVAIDAPEAYPELSGMLATVTGKDTFFDEYKLVLDDVPKGYESYNWDVRTWTLPARYLKPSDQANPDPRPWPSLSRSTRVIFPETNQIGTIHAVRPYDQKDADYQVAMDNGTKVYAQVNDVQEFTEEWKFNGIVHRVRVTPDHSGREGGGWLFMVNSGLNDSIGWVRADAAQALARMILGLPALETDADISDAVDI